jgi:hypothetical protein
MLGAVQYITFGRLIFTGRLQYHLNDILYLLN